MDAVAISQENLAVFQAITDLVTDSGFNRAAVDFMQKHESMFDEEDENKLEYTTIFEEYVTILEQTIDSQLYQKFQEQKIKAFYSDFKDNFAQYQKVNEDTVETLFGFTDFNKFKKQMLEVKKMAGITQSEDLSKRDGLFFIDPNVFWQYYNKEGDTGEGWQKKLEHKGGININMYQKTLKIGNQSHYLNKTDFKYNGIRKDTFINYINNLDKFADGQPGVKEIVTEKDEEGNLKLMYQRIQLPLMSEREIVMSFKYETFTEGEHAGKSLWIMSTVDHPNYPPKLKTVSMHVQKGTLFWEENGEVVGHELSTFDLGGYVPKRLLNMSIGAQVKKGIEESHKQLVKLQQETDSTGTKTD